VTDAAARRALPTDPGSLPAMGADFDAAMDAGLLELGLADGPAAAPRARRSYEAHARLLRDWNAAINLTAIREPAEMARRHVCDSLSAVATLQTVVRPGDALLDIGSGGGYPGLPLAAALPWGRVGLLDSVAKKARFLHVAGAAVRIILAIETDAAPDIEAIAERAEDVAEESGQRAAWDVVVVRAVGSVAEVVELSMPLTRVGGYVIAWKHDDEREGLRDELRAAGSIIRATGGGRPTVVDASGSSLPGHRLVIITKERSTPANYPRAAGVRRRRRR
jgi:16S rRNA (guanine527-N7)-methyltransferase